MTCLNNEQQVVLDTVIAGHNVLITGQAGSGKSFLVKDIFKKLSLLGKNVAIVCSSGISTTVYDDLGAKNATTVHSHYGLRTAELPWRLVVERALHDNLCTHCIKKMDTVIWDEASMSSRRILEIVNRTHLFYIETDITPPHTRPFGGIQLVVVGEFLQLRPVPNLLDTGEFMFKSLLFDRAITHRVELKTLMRQNETDVEFVNCLREVRLGECSDDSLRYIKQLGRDLSVPETEITHIFFRKIPAKVFNINKLQELPGPEIRLQEFDNGDAANINCPAESVLVLKEGCKVMLIWNKSHTLRNGSMGTFMGMVGEDNMEVMFENEGVVQLKRETWQKNNRYGEITGTRLQFPLILAYGITCHRSQGLTLPAAAVHCTKEFVPGLIYVALSRVKKAECLQVLNFRKNQLLPPDSECVNVCQHNSPLLESLQCCRNDFLLQGDLTVSEDINNHADAENEHPPDDTMHQIETIITFFEMGGSQQEAELYLDLDTVYAVLSDEVSHDFIRYPPASFSVQRVLASMKIEVPLSQYAEDVNTCIEHLPHDQLDVLGKVLWGRTCKFVMEESLLDQNDYNLSSKQWSLNTKDLFLHITRSQEFITDFKMLFGVNDLNLIQRSVAADLTQKVYQEVIGAIADRVRKNEYESDLIMNAKEMQVEGLGKIRYMAGWCVAKVLHEKLNYVKVNLVSKIKKTKETVAKCLEMSNLLQEFAVANIAMLQKSSKYPKTHSLTENRQYLSRGLIHVEDCVYEFFLDLENFRINVLNNARLRMFKEKLVDHALAEVLKNDSLIEKWQTCFPSNIDKVIVKDIYSLIVLRYIRAGTGQFLRDYRLAHRLKKSAEHRKNVLQKKQRLEEKKASVPFQDIAIDTSENKISTHHRMLVFIEKYGVSAFVKTMTKEQLIKLCSAYGIVNINKRLTKPKIGLQLVPIMKESNTGMAHSYFLNNLESEVEIDEANRRVSIRISRRCLR
ncbi:ATP-dependent DNA helicase PIF1 [Exaiptasia diaphana]|nr:ATP-dependent DNA helicase PIF1 [Exaiptasia diaphana]